MDELDKKIINLLQADARLPLKKISDQLFISAPAISQRIKHLEKSGVIESYQAHIDYEQATLPIKAFVHLSVNPEQKPEFYEYITSVPNVLSCDCVTGPFSMLIKVVYSSTRLLDQFINDIQHFGRTNTQIVFSTPVPDRGYQFEE
jgi:Lrp/AsnC family leucine-responsive transcriptional regulator